MTQIHEWRDGTACIFWPFLRAAPESSKDWDWLGNSAQLPKPPELEGASIWYYKDASFGPSGYRGGLLLSCSPEAITRHHSNGDSGAVGFSLSCSSCHAQGQGRLPANPRQSHLNHWQTFLLSLFTSPNLSFHHACTFLCPPQFHHKSTTSNFFFLPDSKFDILDSATCMM